MRAPSMSDACETHAQPVEKPIVSLVPRLYRHSYSVMSSSLGTALRLLGSTVLTWDGHARCWYVSQLTLHKGEATQNGQQVCKASHLSGERDLQVSLCSVYSFSRFIQSSAAEAYLVFPFLLPLCDASRSIRSAIDRGVDCL
jgi:hypothetical protein